MHIKEDNAMKKAAILSISSMVLIFLTSISRAQDLDNYTLITHYPFTFTANDTIGNYGPAELINTLFQQGGVYCNGNYIGTESDSCDLYTPDITALNLKKFAMSAMFKVDSVTSIRRPVLVGGRFYKWCTLFIDPDSTVGLAQGSYFETSSSSGVHYSSNTWHTVAFTYDSTEGMGRLYFDGAAVDSSTRVINPRGDRSFTITNGSVSRTFQGYLKDLKIYSWEPPLTGLQRDSLALVALYNSTNGADWTDSENWLTGPLTSWKGVTITGDRVTSIALPSNNVTGTLPVEIGTLDSLNAIYLQTNALSDTIPSEIAQCRRLVIIYLQYNQLTGSIPPQIGNLVYLKKLAIYNNQLTGPIPEQIGNMINLESITLEQNQLDGSLPPALGNLSKLRTLTLTHNNFTGSIPAQLGDLTSLVCLQLTSNNQLAGPIPDSFANLTNLQILELGYCQLEGTVPAWLGNLTGLIRLMLNNNVFTGTLPEQIWDLTNLTALRLEKNQFEGAIPSDVNDLGQLSTFRINDNQFTDLPDISSLPYLSNPFIENNRFTFEDIEPNAGISGIIYSPQDSVGTALDTTVTTGEEVTFSVQVGGTANQYQWYKDQTAIAGATDAAYEIGSAVLADSGIYTCRISNTIAVDLTLESRPFSLHVTPPTGTSDERGAIPDEFRLHQNFPNPFNPGTLISYDLPKNSDVELSVFTITGKLVKNFELPGQAPGHYELEWDGKNSHGQLMPSGIYVCRLTAGRFTGSIRMMLLK